MTLEESKDDAPLVKVCGLTREVDVHAAIEAGADLLGFVSYPRSPRHLSDLVLVALATDARARGARCVLVIVDGKREHVDRLVRDAKLAAVQLCGTEEPGDWHDTPYPLLRRLAVDEGAHDEVAAWRGIADGFVLDHPSSPGGTGRAVDPELAAELALAAPCLLAGGLDADLLDAGLPAPLDARSLAGFDASSRLEAEVGCKDPSAVARYVQAARRAVQSPHAER
ncbi:MAG: hypothetical protein AAGB93_24120 [Planctomycetota bacterium]